MSTTDNTTTTTAEGQEATVTSITEAPSAQAAEATTSPTRATWKQHGQPVSGFWFHGTQVKEANPKGIKVVKVQVDPQGITLVTSAGRKIDGGAFGTATKFWALVPAEAPRYQAPGAQAPAKAEGTKATPKPTTPKLDLKFRGVAVEGYVVRWPHASYDLLLAADKSADPQWLCRCNIHGKTTPVKSGREGDQKGTLAERQSWCSGCKSAAAKAQSTPAS